MIPIKKKVLRPTLNPTQARLTLWRFTCIVTLLAASGAAHGRDITGLRITQPLSFPAPYSTDSTDVNLKPWDTEAPLMAAATDLTSWRQGEVSPDGVLAVTDKDAVRLAGFTLENRNFMHAKVTASGCAQVEIYIDEEKTDEKDLTPGRHDVAVKVLTKAGARDTLRVSIDSRLGKENSEDADNSPNNASTEGEDEAAYVLNPTGKEPYTLSTLMYGERMTGVEISADGQFLMLRKSLTRRDASVEREGFIVDLHAGTRTQVSDFMQWTSEGHKYVTCTIGSDNHPTYELVDAATGQRSTLFTGGERDGRGRILPGERLMLVDKRTEGPKEDKEVFQVLEPDDRQPGWRDRNNIALLDLRNGQTRTITQGQHNVWAEASPDEKKLLLTITEDEITRRPFVFFTGVVLDLETMQADTLFVHDGFVTAGKWSPDGKSVVYTGSPEAFGGVANRVPKGMTPNMIEQELFRIDLDTKKVTPLTADFDPNILSWLWCRADGMIYALTENRDNQDIFRIDPKTGKAEMLRLSERFVLTFDVAADSPTLTYYGQGHSNSDRLYVVNLRNGKEQLVEDLDAVRMKDVELGEFGEWNFKAERGDTIYGRYYLPPHFDPSRKYPMLVYYYGGCSPVGRYLDSYYSYHGWAAMGYVVYVIQPSGCTGFGQEFAARHVNAYGDYTAEDIMQGTRLFCEDHPFVNEKKIGCLGASYGGFMTQYLITQTDMFAAAVSHAGISDPSSYWGYGYWGYSYSAVSAADSYPWNNSELFNEHAPLTLADRVHTPILFMHGNADTNVPINESIQMFTALKILGRECAFVTVDGQDHHILDMSKRIKWQYTIYAWFEKWLKDDPTWWESLYTPKNLR